jgi:hypothetical protein
VTVRHCNFVNASVTAIRTIGRGYIPGGCVAAACNQWYMGTASTQFTVADSLFTNNAQVAVNWCDLMAFKDVWVSHFHTVAFENHDKLHITRMLGVPPHATPGRNQRWIDNFADGGGNAGTVVARDARFGGEGGGLPVVFNFASAFCYPGEGYDDCRPPPPRSALPANATYANLGNIVIDSCAIDSMGNHVVNTSIFLAEIPSQLIIRNSEGFSYGPRSVEHGFSTVRVSSALDLDVQGGQMAYASAHPGTFRFLIEGTNAYIAPTQAELPVQLQPHQVGRVYRDAPPLLGEWRRNQLVWARLGAPEPGPLGWRCVSGGSPGNWTPFETMMV